MSPAGFALVFALTLGAFAFALLAVEARSLVRSTYLYVAHSCFLILIYVTYAVFTGNNYLFVWAGLCVVNTWILPFLVGGLKFTAARISGEIRVPRSTTFLFAGVAVLAIASVAALSSFSLVVPTSPIDNLDKTVSLNLLAALLLFVYGIIVMLTHRHLFKLALGLLIMTAGAHLTLIQMAPKFFTMVEIEVLTKVMGTVFAMLYAARLLSERFQSADASELLSSQE